MIKDTPSKSETLTPKNIWNKHLCKCIQSFFFYFFFFLFYKIIPILWVSSFVPALIWFDFSMLGVFIISSPIKTNILVNLVLFFNDDLFLFCCFLKSGVANELKRLFSQRAIKSWLFIQNGQNFAAHKRLAWPAYVWRTDTARFFKKMSSMWARYSFQSHLLY